MESQVRDGFVTEYLCSLRKCEEVLIMWQKKKAKLDCYFSSREKHSKFKKNRMVIENSEAFFNASECVCYSADTKNRQREMSIIKECREKRVFPVGELKHINQRLKILEEDIGSMKKAILWHVKEKRRLVKRIYHYFQCMQYMLLHRSKATKGEQVCHQKLIMKTPKDGGALLTGLPEVLYHNSNLNPSLITKGFQATVNYSPHIYDSSI